MKKKQALFILIVGLLGFVLISQKTTLGAGVFLPIQGGTGTSTVSASDVGKYLKISDDSPFTYTFDTPASGGGGSFPFSADTNYNQVVYSTSTPTLWFKSGIFASSTSYFADIQANKVKLGNWGGNPAYQGVWLTNSAPSFSNYAFLDDNGVGTLFNAPASGYIHFRINNATIANITANGLSVNNGATANGSGIGLVVASGNTGLGTTSPYAKLSVVGEAVASHFTATSTTATSTFNGGLKLGTTNMFINSSGDFTISPVGEVMIGTTTQQSSSRLLTVGATSGFQFRVSTLGAITHGSYQATPVEVIYGGTGMSSVQQGSILFGSSVSTTLAQDNANLYWDDSNNRLGIGTTSPGASLAVVGGTSGATTRFASFRTSGTGNDTGTAISLENSTLDNATQGGVRLTALRTNTGVSGMTDFVIGASNGTVAALNNEIMRVGGNGFVGIGTSSPYAKLSVTGHIAGEYFTATSTTATSTIYGAFQIGSTAGDNALKLTARSGGYPSSDSVGGMANFTNTNNFGSALTLYSNAGVGRTNDLLRIKSDNVLNDQRGLFITQDGTRSAALFDCTNTTRVTGGECVNITDVAGANRTTLGISGAPVGLGLLKFTVNSGADANASALSMQIDDADPQGLFIDTVTGYTGKFLNIRNFGTELMTFTSAGNLGLGTSSPISTLSIVGNTSTTTLYLGAKNRPSCVTWYSTPSGNPFREYINDAGTKVIEAGQCTGS